MTNIIDKIRVSGTDYTLSATSSGGNPTVELTQAEYDALVSAGTVSADTYYIITDAQAGDLTQYWTSAQTNSAINQAVSGKANSNDVYLKTETSGVTQLNTAFENKQDTLVSGFNIKTINNESILGGGNIDIQGGGIDSGTVQTMIDESISGKTNQSNFVSHSGNTTMHVTASEKSTWNNKSDFSGDYNDLTNKPTIPTVPTNVSDFTNDAGYITSDAISGKADTSAVTESINAAVSGKVDISTFNTYSASVETALSGKVDTSTYNTYTAATDTAIDGKQAILVSGTNIKTINNESILGSGNIEIGGGGGKAVTAGTGIAITTGETADTVSLDIRAKKGSVNTALIFNYINSNTATAAGATSFGYMCKATNQYTFANGNNTQATGYYSHSEGESTIANGWCSHSDGQYTNANGKASHTEGSYVNADNDYESSQGRYNVSNKANTTWGDSGNTLFSVGNGTSTSARHNAFEIRQNGDIYLSSGGTDIKLQDHLGGGGGSITIDPTLDSGSTNAVANSAITEAVLVPSYRQLTRVEDNVQFPNTTALYVENVTGGSYINQCYYQIYLSGNSQVDEMIMVNSFSGHTFAIEPQYVDYEWTEDDSLILTPKTSGNYFYKVWYVWNTGFGVYTIVDYPSGSSSSVIQNTIYPKLIALDNKTDDTILSASYNYSYSDFGGYWISDLYLNKSNKNRLTAEMHYRYDDFGCDNEVITVKKTSGATSGSTDCITSGGVYEQMRGKVDTSAITTSISSSSTDAQVPSAKAVNDKLGGLSIVKLTQAEYDALATKDNSTLYVIVN